jgi:hypothetical protein
LAAAGITTAPEIRIPASSQRVRMFIIVKFP